jgi:hypothetical protein
MSQPNSSLDREAFVFMKREEQDHASRFLTEEEYFTAPAQPYSPGLWDVVMIRFGDWLIKVGSELKTRNVCTELSEKQV